jgi:hypothetical protein
MVLLGLILVWLMAPGQRAADARPPRASVAIEPADRDSARARDDTVAAKTPGANGEAGCYPFRPVYSPGLAAAADEAGLKLVAYKPDAAAPMPRVVVWQCRDSVAMTDAWAEAVGEHVRQGGGLLLCFSKGPGRAAMRLAFLSPTTAWDACGNGDENSRGPVRLAEADETFFGTDPAVQDFAIPWFIEIRPFHAVERGQARYDRFARPAPWVRYEGPKEYPILPPDSDWWSRPLLNRDWRIRARGQDVGGSPLVLTGRYGAGRVAVFASALEHLADNAANRSVMGAVLRWLTAGPPPPVKETVFKLPAPKSVVDAESRRVRVTFKNPTREPLPVEVVARLLSWQQALVGDVRREAELPAEGSTVIEIPLPAIGPTSYQELAWRDAWHVRLGVLSAKGATLLAESRIDADLRPALKLSVRTDDVSSIPYPFDAPEPDTRAQAMALPVMSYAYPPGQKINAHVTLENGLRNLAPLAQVRDESEPDSPSLSALTDESVAAEHRPGDNIEAYGYYLGPKDKDCSLSFTFPHPVWLAEVVLLGAPDDYRLRDRHNPQAVLVEIDGREVAREPRAAERFLQEQGLLRLCFNPVSAKQVRLTMPRIANRGRSLESIWLGEVYLNGSLKPPPAIQGQWTVDLVDARTGKVRQLDARNASLDPFQRVEMPLSVSLPADEKPGFYRLQARFEGQDTVLEAAAPVFAIRPRHPLATISNLFPQSAALPGFIVTRGFRNVFDTGTGTSEIGEGWGQPDDLVWAYERGLKQLGPRTPTQAGRLYVSENDMKHYSTPWKPFCNGEEFFDLATPRLVAWAKKDWHWPKSQQLTFDFSDRWDTGPSPESQNSWQDYEAFHNYLRANGQPGLIGRTRLEIGKEIHDKYQGFWYAWHFGRYIHSMQNLHDDFAREGKTLLVSAQGVPLVPGKEAGVVGQMVQGANDDATWGMLRESATLTTARQMSDLAFTPSLLMATHLCWGYNSAALNNPQWHEGIGTTEPSRRLLYDRAFRGTLRPDGSYSSMHAFGYKFNVGSGLTVVSEEFDARERVKELHSLLTPEEPLGAGIVLSTAWYEKPENFRFECGDPMSFPECRHLAYAVWYLHDAGISIPFSANARCLENWQGNAPLLIANLHQFSEQELAMLGKLAARGVRLVAFSHDEQLSAAAAALFGVHDDATPADGTTAGQIAGRPIVAKGNCLLIPLATSKLTAMDTRSLAPLLRRHLKQTIIFPAGTAGYAFRSNGRTFVVVEDYREEPRTATLRLTGQARGKTVRAVDVNEHRPLKTEPAGEDWLVGIPLRSGDGVLVSIEVEP